MKKLCNRFVAGESVTIQPMLAKKVAKHIESTYWRVAEMATYFKSVPGQEQFASHLAHLADEAKEFAPDGVIDGRFAQLAVDICIGEKNKLQMQLRQLDLTLEKLGYEAPSWAKADPVFVGED